MEKKEIFGMTLEEIQEAFLALGIKKYRALQVFRWLYQQGVTSFAEMTNLAKTDRELLAEKFNLSSGLVQIVKELASEDGLTNKVLLEFPDKARVETVVMHHDYGYSVCLSSQVGCNMNCAFCASGISGFERNLTAGEILAQVYYFQRMLQKQGARVSRVVVMGSGEPLLNLANVLQALDILHSDYGLCIGYRNMTISTCGIIPGIISLTQAQRTINLAVSLHASTDTLRSRLMPVNKTYNYLKVIEAATNYEKVNGRQVMYEYILLKGINDSREDAEMLADILQHRNCVVNLIPANPVPEKGFNRPQQQVIDGFFQTLKARKINVTMRKEMGKDINAACGQLRAMALKEETSC